MWRAGSARQCCQLRRRSLAHVAGPLQHRMCLLCCAIPHVAACEFAKAPALLALLARGPPRTASQALPPK